MRLSFSLHELCGGLRKAVNWRSISAKNYVPAAEWAEQASGLLAGGITAHRVPEILSECPRRDSPDVTPDWAVVFTVWQLADQSGASRVEALTQISHALKAVQRLRERRMVLLAGPRSTTILVSVLPVIAWVLGAALGMNASVVLQHSWGWVLLITGGVLWAAGTAWLRAIYQKLSACDVVAGFECVLMSLAMASGSDMGTAARQVVASVHPAAGSWIRLSEFARGGSVSEALALSSKHGIPVSRMLLGVAETQRNQCHAALEAAAERMGVAVLIPLGVCILPAFFAVGVVPVIASIVLQIF